MGLQMGKQLLDSNNHIPPKCGTIWVLTILLLIIYTGLLAYHGIKIINHYTANYNPLLPKYSYFITTIRKFKNLKSPLILVSPKKTNLDGTLQTM